MPGVAPLSQRNSSKTTLRQVASMKCSLPAWSRWELHPFHKGQGSQPSPLGSPVHGALLLAVPLSPWGLRAGLAQYWCSLCPISQWVWATALLWGDRLCALQGEAANIQTPCSPQYTPKLSPRGVGMQGTHQAATAAAAPAAP